ncbi:hypothetical protein ACIRD3_08820 [Kitasatospora sp. NPDC093550]|uniref:hypothetical protein n=1 Tax=Kitasatospora sp. NPDC093550 TaxID=3364089 RepID=UPI0038158D47
MQRWIILTVASAAVTGIAAAVTGIAAPGPAADPAPEAATTVTLGDATIDPKLPGRVRVDVGYLCSVATEARSLTVSVEQKDPQDSSSIAFGSSRTAEADVTCDGTPQRRQIVVQSKTFNWIPGVDAVLTATVANIGATPPAAADAKRAALAAPAAPTTPAAPSATAGPATPSATADPATPSATADLSATSAPSATS